VWFQGLDCIGAMKPAFGEQTFAQSKEVLKMPGPFRPFGWCGKAFKGEAGALPRASLVVERGSDFFCTALASGLFAGVFIGNLLARRFIAIDRIYQDPVLLAVLAKNGSITLSN
jgi:hypothetical protein